MHDEENWINFMEGVLEVERLKRCNREQAKRKLREACATGRIHSLKAPYGTYTQTYISELPFEFWIAIAPDDWRKRKVDLDGPDSDGSRTVVKLQKEQFEDWLKEGARPTNQRDEAIQNLLANGRIPPTKISWKEFCGLVRDNAQGWEAKDKPAHGFSNKQIGRVVARLKQTFGTS